MRAVFVSRDDLAGSMRAHGPVDCRGKKTCRGWTYHPRWRIKRTFSQICAQVFEALIPGEAECAFADKRPPVLKP
jgi:hypothetical protein